MSLPRYFARSASDKTDDWPFWFVADRNRGDINVTADLIRAIIDPSHQGRVFALREDAKILANMANAMGREDATDDADGLARLRADVERLTASLAAEVEESERLRRALRQCSEEALTTERRHGDMLAEVLQQCALGLNGGAGRQALAALIRHRTRRQG